MRVFSVFLMFSSLAAFAPAALGAGSVDAGRPYLAPGTGLCRSCHSDPPEAPRFDPYRFNPSGLTNAFTLIGAMNGNLALDAQTINDIATYLGLPDSNDTDRLLDWAEDVLPDFLSPARLQTLQVAGYTFRFYSTAGVFVATKDGDVWIFDGRTLQNLGTLRSFLDLMPDGR